MKKNICGFAGIVMFCWCSACLADVNVTVGSHRVLGQKTDEKVTLLVTGGDLVDALNLNVQIGLWDSADNYLAAGPHITDLDVVSGTIFSGAVDPSLAKAQMLNSRLWASSFLADSTVSANGVLATLTLDTTRMSSGTYELRLMQTMNGDSDFGIAPALIANGSIVISVPEPSSLGLLALVAIGLSRRVRKS